MSNTEFFATCPKTLEGLLEQELQALGAAQTKQTVAGVYFHGDLELAYRACLWSRLANRILLPLRKVHAATTQQLYDGIRTIKWLQHLKPSGTLLVDFAGQSAAITNTHFGAQKVKDAIVDEIRDRTGSRPTVAKENPDVRINVYLYNDIATVSLDLSGESLHRRGYRLQSGAAPLKENLAAAILLRANWPEIAKNGGSLIDPMCGSGTLLIEAAMIAGDIAPGLLREHFGFQNWLKHAAKTWDKLWDEAKERRAAGLKKLPFIAGFDAHRNILEKTEANIATAELTDYIKLFTSDIYKLTQPDDCVPGLVITNPPYGERMSEIPDLMPLYRQLGSKLKQEFTGWQAAVLMGHPELGRNMGLRAKKNYSFFNGALACKLFLFDIQAQWFVGD